MAVCYCAIKGCENRGASGNDENFLIIPKNKARAALWLSYCKDGTSITQGRVCSNHFSKNDYKSTDKPCQYLKDDAIPTIGVKSQRDILFISATKNKQGSNISVEKAVETKTEIITKQKMEQLLYHTKCCSVCLENDGHLHDFETKVNIIDMHQDIGGNLQEIVNKVFGETISKSLPSSYICENCTETVINSYIFIQKVKQTVKTLEGCIDDLLFKVDDTSHKVDEANNMDHVILTLFDEYGNQATQDHFEDEQDSNHSEENFESAPFDHVSSDSETSHTISKARKVKFRFNCPVCATQKCIHRKYLKWFDSQKVAGNREVKCRHCDNDNKTYKTRSAYIEHVENIHIKVPKFMCDQCNQILSSKHEFRRHMRKFHTKLFECQHCELKFNEESICNIHMSTCSFNKGPLSNKERPAIFDSHKQFDAYKIKHSQTYSCNMCFFKTKSIRGFKNHKNKTHSLVEKIRATHFDCTICHKVFKGRKRLILHMKLHPADSIHTCKFCTKEFRTQHICRLHIRHVHLINTAVESQKLQENTFHTNLHEDDDVGSFLCQHCGKGYDSKGALNAHMKDHKGLVSCPVCLTMLQPSSMKNHMWRHRGYENDPNFQIKHNQQRKQKYFCDQCNYFTSSANYIESHINRFHLKIHPYICATCKKTFSGKHLLRIHQQVHDTKISMFSCDLCEKVFRQQLGLKMHMRSAHTGEKPYSCEVCGELFISTTLLCRHKRKKHETVPRTRMNCPLCDISLLNVVEVRRHIRRIHWKGEGKFNMAEVEGLTKEDRDRLEDLRRTSYGF